MKLWLQFGFSNDRDFWGYFIKLQTRSKLAFLKFCVFATRGKNCANHSLTPHTILDTIVLYLQLHTSFNIVLGQMEKNYISGVKYGLQEWPDDDGYNVDVS